MIRPTLRDCVWFAALALVALGWLLDHENLTHDNNQRLERAKAAWSDATLREFEQIRLKAEYINQRLMEKFPDTELTPAE